jgi:cbb3-type cytochrome oxidase subunit 3
MFCFFQVILLVLWTVLWKRKRAEQAKEVISLPDNSTDSLSYLYESGFSRRLQ